MSATATTRSILLVEDEPTLQRILGSVLGDAGHRVEAVGTAEQALERLDDGAEFDLVLTDKNLPHKNGLELLGELRASELQRRRPIGVILVTGYPGRDSAARALDDDVDGYLIKPFRSLTVAVEQVQRVLDADLVTRRAGTALARRIGAALRGADDDLSGLSVVVLDIDAAAARLEQLGAAIVDQTGLGGAAVVVARRVEDLVVAARQRPGIAAVLVDGGATFADLVDLIGAGGGAVVDGQLIAGASS